MNALHLTTRFKDGAYQGEACLLVYDEQHLSGAALSQDVRNLFEHRPATGRVYILAPFLSEDEVRHAFHDGALFSRIRSYFHATGGRLYLLTFLGLLSEKRMASFAIPFTVGADGCPKEEAPELLGKDLRSGWLFDLFDRHRGRLDAPAGVHFGKSSGKHSNKFLRASAALLSSSACAAVAYFTLGAIDTRQPKRIFVDTAPLITVGFAMQRIAIKNGIWSLEVPVNSFSSYGGIAELPAASGRDIVVVSASTSGSLVKALIEQEFKAKSIATLFFLESTISSPTDGEVICDLTFKSRQPFGYPPVESYKIENCPFCRDGYFLAQLEGDQFQLERRAVKRLMVRSGTQKKDARKTLELLARKDILKTELFRTRSAISEFSLEADALLDQIPELCTGVHRSLRRFVPIPLNYVVLVGISKVTFQELAKNAGVSDAIKDAQLIDHNTLAGLKTVQGGSALVVFGFLNDFARARDINASLRTIVPQGCVAYISVLTVANSAEHLSDLKMFLTFGEYGKDTFSYDAALSLMLPARGEELSPWELELEMLNELIDGASAAAEFSSRRDILSATGSRSASLFWPGQNGELGIKNDFVYLSVGKDPSLISQADIYATVSNLLSTVRANNRGLTEPVQRGQEAIYWHQSVYGHVLLDAGNFADYNDAVLQAAFLRAARAAELKYDSDPYSSSRLLSLLNVAILDWPKGGGEALPEFLISMATARLTLTPADMLVLKDNLSKSHLPDYLKQLGERLKVDNT